MARWTSTSVLEHVFDLADKGKELTCRVYHLAYTEKGYKESTVSLDLMCKYNSRQLKICLVLPFTQIFFDFPNY